MVLRSGIIIPFQFRENKKLLTVGVPEENRDLSIWDLKNVVRSAFGIYNFEFRNKKIGFSIPDELLLNYLGQRHDLTNFVIEIVQACDLSLGCSSCGGLSFRKCTDGCKAFSLNTETPEQAHSSRHRFRRSSNSSNDASPSSEPENNRKRRRQDASIEPSSLPVVLNAASLNSAEAEAAAEISHDSPKVEFDCISNEEQPATSAAADLHFEHMQMHHEYYLQQQQQQQQQQQLQQNMELIIPEQSPGGNTMRQRKERMSRKQKEVYLAYLEQTPIMSEYKRSDPHLDVYWQKLADILNSVPQGAVKSISEWKQSFDNWRFRIYLYARYNLKLASLPTKKCKNFKPLTLADKRAYSLWIRNADTAPPDLDQIRNVFENIDPTQLE